MSGNSAVNDLILAIDPGRDKCGIALVKASGELIFHAVVPRVATVDRVAALVEEHGLARILLGHATASRAIEDELRMVLPELEITTVDETGSTLEARALYWQHNPPRGWRRLAPLSLQMPPEPVDDFAAVVLAKRFIDKG